MAQRIKVSNGNVLGGVYTAYMQVVQNEDNDPRLVVISDPNNILNGMEASIDTTVEEWEFTWTSGSFVKEAIDQMRTIYNTQLGIDQGDPPPSYLPESSVNMLHAEYISNSDEDISILSVCYIDDPGFAGLTIKAIKGEGDLDTFHHARGTDWVKFTFIYPNNLSPVVED